MKIKLVNCTLMVVLLLLFTGSTGLAYTIGESVIYESEEYVLYDTQVSGTTATIADGIDEIAMFYFANGIDTLIAENGAEFYIEDEAYVDIESLCSADGMSEPFIALAYPMNYPQWYDEESWYTSGNFIVYEILTIEDYEELVEWTRFNPDVWSDWFTRNGTVITGLSDYGEDSIDSGNTELMLPYGTTAISDFALSKKHGITKISFPKTVRITGEDSVSCCENLVEINLNDGLETIGMYSFADLPLISDIVIPESVNRIEDGAFYNSNINSMTIPDGVVYLGNEVFACSALKTVEIGSGVEELSVSLFENSDIEEIYIPDNITKINMYAFKECMGLHSIEIPASVEEVDKEAFRSCTSLICVIIRNPQMTIGTNAFKDCHGQLVIYGYPNSTAQEYAEENNIEFALISTLDDFEWDKTTITGLSTIGAVKISNGDTVVEIPKYCSKIKTNAFSGQNLSSSEYYLTNRLITEVIIPSTVCEIESGAFTYTSGMTDLTINEGVQTIGANAFSYSGITSAEIPDTVTSLGGSVFAGNANMSTVNIGTGLTALPRRTFYNCTALTEIEIPLNITEIGAYAFYGCNHLGEVTLHIGIDSIGNYAFYNTTAMEALTVLSPSAVFGSNVLTANCATIIYGMAGSTAAAYAQNNNMEFEPLSGNGVTLTLEEGDTQQLVLRANGISNMCDRTFTLFYNSSMIEISDICALNSHKDVIKIGEIEDVGIEVVNSESGVVSFKIKSDSIDDAWNMSGIINIIEVRSLMGGSSSVDLIYN